MAFSGSTIRSRRTVMETVAPELRRASTAVWCSASCRSTPFTWETDYDKPTNIFRQKKHTTNVLDLHLQEFVSHFHPRPRRRTLLRHSGDEDSLKVQKRRMRLKLKASTVEPELIWPHHLLCKAWILFLQRCWCRGRPSAARWSECAAIRVKDTDSEHPRKAPEANAEPNAFGKNIGVF